MSGASDDFGLDPRARALLENVFERHPRIVEARVFGSRALGTYRGESDIDIALYGDLDEALVARVAGELEELPLPYQFDVRAYSTVRHAGLLKHIERVGRRIFARRGAPATGRRDPRGGGRGFRARWVDPTILKRTSKWS